MNEYIYTYIQKYICTYSTHTQNQTHTHLHTHILSKIQVSVTQVYINIMIPGLYINTYQHASTLQPTQSLVPAIRITVNQDRSKSIPETVHNILQLQLQTTQIMENLGILHTAKNQYYFLKNAFLRLAA